MPYENSRQRRKREAEQHNKERAERLALEKDKRENPEKYRRKRRKGKASIMPHLAMAMAISPTAFEQRILK